MTVADYPRIVAPDWDYLEANTALGAILTAEKVAEAEVLNLSERGDPTDAKDHLVMLIRAERALRKAMGL